MNKSQTIGAPRWTELQAVLFQHHDRNISRIINGTSWRGAVPRLKGAAVGAALRRHP